jgi:hypothetical protein
VFYCSCLGFFLLLWLTWFPVTLRLTRFRFTNAFVQSQSYFTTGGLLPISSPWRQAPCGPTTRIFIFQLNTCSYSPYVTSSLTRGCVCRLQLLLFLASAVILRSGSRGTHDHILLSQIRDSPTSRPRSPYLCPPGTGWLGYTPRHWVHLVLFWTATYMA